MRHHEAVGGIVHQLSYSPVTYATVGSLKGWIAPNSGREEIGHIGHPTPLGEGGISGQNGHFASLTRGIVITHIYIFFVLTSRKSPSNYGIPGTIM